MKSFARILFFSGLSLAGLYACQKELSDVPKSHQNSQPHALTLSSSSVKKGQALLVSLPAGLTDNSANWVVRPATGTQITPAGQSATITFSNSGTYYITAIYITDSVSGIEDSATAPVTVSDSSYTGAADSLTLAGEKFVLVAQLVPDTGSTLVDTGITFVIQTVDSYPCNAYVAITQNSLPRSDSVTLSSVVLNTGNACAGVTVPAENSFTINHLAVGSTSTITIFLPDGEGVFQFTGWSL